MSTAGALGETLQAWRARISPEDVGLPTYGERRRVSGLRREELALLAGVSASYYTRLEQGHSRNASPEVLDAIARALNLTAAERQHLGTLAAVRPRTTPRRPPAEHVDEALSDLLTALGDVPALVLGRRSDVLAWNPAGHALLAGHLAADGPHHARTRPNMTELVFLDPDVRALYADWPAKARAVVGNLRLTAGLHADDPLLAALIGRLSLNSPDFARLWGDHRVHPCATADYELHHPLVGTLTVTQQSLKALQAPEQTLVTCTAPAASPSAQALALLAQLRPHLRRPSHETRIPRHPDGGGHMIEIAQ
ncbi:helix-turn-helix domain-containing protein [Kineosporia succinea]|uniref:Transcriptional regulator with XRE-family HTH domain n=1 Tax=Kineosporia succinea TaxID=84632 RepID=A0ABT9PCX8_9ACTN|nr:helix-turn-helix transcriptional regulator [Kineosporia succinea]MDP9830342.1 transcriptional regulator with XRE-family HTH domain [Kineosporia succinea]